jgi:hypothetical protein
MATDRAVLRYALTISRAAIERYDVWVSDSTPMSRKDRGNGTPHPHPFLPRHGGETGYVTDVDALSNHLKDLGLTPGTPRDASWGRTRFPDARSDGRELSFARPIRWFGKSYALKGEPPTAAVPVAVVRRHR